MYEFHKKSICLLVAVSLSLLASKYCSNLFANAKNICFNIRKRRNESTNDKLENRKKELKISLDKVILADSPEKCDYAIQRIHCDLSDGILGFDCEWVNQGPISVLQLATKNGVCALFRLGKIGYVPVKLKELLANKRFLKVGVSSFEDGRKLCQNYNCVVVGTVDLRILVEQLALPNRKSLAALCLQYLGLDMDKILEVRCSDWDSETLTDEQKAYASYDALVSVLIYQQILQEARKNLSIWKKLKIYLKKLCSRDYNEWYFGLPEEVIDKRYKGIREKDISINSLNNTSKKIGQIMDRNRNNDSYKNSIPARNKPLYHNCYLQAPDGDVLCTCDKKKADWYVSKNLGEVVNESPFTVKLKFEPSGRALGEVGKYYTQVKLNQCVVCGATDKFIRKNVVPREYRKYFPLVMKSHQSHDVLLLCPGCHELSNLHDLQLRKQLAEMCDAPLSGPMSHVRNEIPRGLRMLHSSVKALREGKKIPINRRKELEHYIISRTGYKEITPMLLNALNEQLTSNLHSRINFNFPNSPIKSAGSTQTKFLPHGLKVVQYFENIEAGLVELEKLWREHFLDTMKPKYLPELWSVCHNQERLSLRQIQNRIEPSDAKVAGLKSS